VKWQQEELDLPEMVKNETNKYKKDEDSVRQFVEACCVEGNDKAAAASKLYKSYINFCEGNALFAVTNVIFGRELQKRYRRKKSGSIFYHGIGLMGDQG